VSGRWIRLRRICVGQMAKQLARRTTAELFANGPKIIGICSMTNTGFMRGKLADGSGASRSTAATRVGDYTEPRRGTIPGSCRRTCRACWSDGRRREINAKLDKMFSEASGVLAISPTSPASSANTSRQRPCHHVASLYNYAGAP